MTLRSILASILFTTLAVVAASGCKQGPAGKVPNTIPILEYRAPDVDEIAGIDPDEEEAPATAPEPEPESAAPVAPPATAATEPPAPAVTPAKAPAPAKGAAPAKAAAPAKKP